MFRNKLGKLCVQYDMDYGLWVIVIYLEEQCKLTYYMKTNSKFLVSQNMMDFKENLCQ